MIALAKEADEDYGRRLEAGLDSASEHTESSKPMGGTDDPGDAAREGHEADPY